MLRWHPLAAAPHVRRSVRHTDSRRQRLRAAGNNDCAIQRIEVAHLAHEREYAAYTNVLQV